MKFLTPLVFGLLVSLSMPGRSAVIYSDNFSSDADRSTPAGFIFSTNDSTNNFAYIITPSDYQYGITANGSNFLEFGINGPDAGLVPPPYPGAFESAVMLNVNVGSTFLANTTYTLSYNIAGGNALNTSFMSDGSEINSTAQSASAGSSSFVPGPAVTIDTAIDTSIIGHIIGFETDLTSPSLQYSWNAASTGYTITAVADVPEPSTYAFLGVGLLLLLGLQRIRQVSSSLFR